MILLLTWGFINTMVRTWPESVNTLPNLVALWSEYGPYETQYR